MPEKEKKPDMGPTIKDFDKLAPAQRQARLGGRVIDVTTIPARVLLEAAKFADEMEKYSGEERLVKAIGIVSRIACVHDEAITTDWLLDNCSLDQLMAFVDFTLEPLKKRVAEEGGKGEAVTAGS
jgi:hypothetical protein